MAITAKQEEGIELLTAELKGIGERLTPQQVADAAAGLPLGKKLSDTVRAAIYLESMHRREQERNWDKLIPVDSFIETLVGEL